MSDTQTPQRTELEARKRALLRPDTQTLEEKAFALVQRKASLFAASDLVPEAYKGKIGNCVIAMEMAARMGLSPLEVMQNLHVIHGRGMWSGQFVIGRINGSGMLKGRLRFDFEKDGDRITSCRAWGIDREIGERVEGAKVTWDMAEKEGWTRKQGSKWLTMPEQMFPYRAATFFVRVHAPELLGGLPAEGEIEDAGHVEGEYKVLPPSPAITQAEVDAILKENLDSPPAEGQGAGLESAATPAAQAGGPSGGAAGPHSRNRRGAPKQSATPPAPPAAGPGPSGEKGEPSKARPSGGGSSQAPEPQPATDDQIARIESAVRAMTPETVTAFTTWAREMFGAIGDDYLQYTYDEAGAAEGWIERKRAEAKAARTPR